jgi:glucose/arabinose dehydrogenase
MTYMPSFSHYGDVELEDLIAFIGTKPAPDAIKEKLDPNALKNPIPEPIPMSDLVVNLELFTEIPASSEEKPSTRIAKLSYQPETDQLFVMDLRGKLYYLKDKKPVVYLDMAQVMPNFIHKPGLATGFGSFAFHPDFARNGLLYTTHTEPPATAKADFAYADSIDVTLQWVLTEWKTQQPGAFPFSGKSRELFRVNMVTGIHGVQEITFNPFVKKGDPDYGLLYIGVGDGGSAESGYPFLCNTTEQIWGSVICIDPMGRNSNNGKYGIPVSNPFAGSKNAAIHQEIYASGFRNPHRIAWSKGGDMFIANIGHHKIESLYIIKPGSNSGWPIREGTFLIDPSQNMFNIYPLPADDAKNNFNYPVVQYDHDEGVALAGGFEYRGKDVPELTGKFLLGDIVRGRLFYAEMKDLRQGVQAPIKELRISYDGSLKTLTEMTGANKVDFRFGRDRHGELYLTTKPDGKVYKLAGASTGQK